MKPLIVRIGEERFYSIKNKQIVHFLDDEEENIFFKRLRKLSTCIYFSMFNG